MSEALMVSARSRNLIEDPLRLSAMRTGAKRWISTTPCEACGGVERYVFGRAECSACAAERNRKNRDEDEKDEFQEVHWLAV